ncbi:hypothetical protein IFR05_008252 [Cadophora sp. M221]|nr:hypothetical protein IFR05_008252 [Cadophora sp. M221]
MPSDAAQYIVDDPMDIDSDLFSIFDFHSDDPDDEWLHQADKDSSKAALLGLGVVAEAEGDAAEQEKLKPGPKFVESNNSAAPISPDTLELYGFEAGDGEGKGEGGIPYSPRANADALEAALSTARIIGQVDAVEQWARIPDDLECRDDRVVLDNPRAAAAAAALRRMTVAGKARTQEQENEQELPARPTSTDVRPVSDSPRASAAAAALRRSGVVEQVKIFEEKQQLEEKGSASTMKETPSISPPILPPLFSMVEDVGMIRGAWYLRRRPRFPQMKRRPIAAKDFVIKSRVAKNHQRSTRSVRFRWVNCSRSRDQLDDAVEAMKSLWITNRRRAAPPPAVVRRRKAKEWEHKRVLESTMTRR